MAIEKHKDPKTRQEYLLAVGKVDGVYVNELKEKKTYTGGKNGPWTPTHSINLVVDGTRISLGLTEKESVRAKDINDEYQDVERGAEVSVVVEENGEYKGVTQYQSRASQITVLEVAPKQAAPAASGNAPQKPRDNTGVEIGHSINGAFNIFRQDASEDVISLAKQVHELTTTLKKEYAEKNPKMSAYDVGAMVGNAVLNGTLLESNIDDIEISARNVLDNVVPAVSEYVRGEKKQDVLTKESPVKESKKPKANKPVVEKAPTDDNQFGGDGGGFEDMDDDIPF